jgi:hypothetical protein
MQTLQIEEQAHCAVLGKAEIGCTSAQLNNTVRPPSNVNSCIELHDSRLSEVLSTDSGVTLHFTPVYLHRSTGRPGLDVGTGWVQDARLLFSNATVTGGPYEWPCDVMDGALVIGAKTHDNEIPVPLEFTGAVELRLAFGPRHTLTVTATKVRLELIGQPRYVEEFTP